MKTSECILRFNFRDNMTYPTLFFGLACLKLKYGKWQFLHPYFWKAKQKLQRLRASFKTPEPGVKVRGYYYDGNIRFVEKTKLGDWKDCATGDKVKPPLYCAELSPATKQMFVPLVIKKE